MAEKLPPQPSPGYVGMLALTCIAMLVGVVVMAMEGSEYDFDPKPKATQKIELPKAAGSVALDLPPAAVAEVQPEAPKPTAVAAAKPDAQKPATVAKTEVPTPAPAPVATPKADPVTPTAGPTPSPLNFNRPKPAPPAEPAPPATPGVPTPSPLRIGR